MAAKEKESKDKTQSEKWRDAERKARASELAAAADRDVADALASDLAKAIIEGPQKNATIELDGAAFAPKKSATRNPKDGTAPKPPKFPYQLVTYRPKSSVDI